MNVGTGAGLGDCVVDLLLVSSVSNPQICEEAIAPCSLGMGTAQCLPHHNVGQTSPSSIKLLLLDIPS